MSQNFDDTQQHASDGNGHGLQCHGNGSDGQHENAACGYERGKAGYLRNIRQFFDIFHVWSRRMHVCEK